MLAAFMAEHSLHTPATAAAAVISTVAQVFWALKPWTDMPLDAITAIALERHILPLCLTLAELHMDAAAAG